MLKNGINSSNAIDDMRNNVGQTPMHSAAARLDVGTIVALFAHGANVNTIDARGNTPLHIAITVTYNYFDFSIGLTSLDLVLGLGILEI